MRQTPLLMFQLWGDQPYTKRKPTQRQPRSRKHTGHKSMSPTTPSPCKFLYTKCRTPCYSVSAGKEYTQNILISLYSYTKHNVISITLRLINVHVPTSARDCDRIINRLIQIEISDVDIYNLNNSSISTSTHGLLSELMLEYCWLDT